MAENGAVYMGSDPWLELSTQHGQLAQGQVKLAEDLQFAVQSVQ